MNIQQALKQAALLLDTSSSASSDNDSRLDAQILLKHVLQCNSAHIIAWPEKVLEEEQQERFLQLIKQRAQGIPVAHLTGSREFWSLEFDIDDSTLIPRPETETLVEFILASFGDRKNLHLLDLGTGTGAIAIAIAKEKPRWEIAGCDISAAAIKLARRNSEKHGISNIEFVESNWFDRLLNGRFDIIVSNPPYIADQDPHLHLGDVRFEPRSALVSGKTGMDDIEHLCQHAKQHLKDAGWLVIEHGYDQQKQVYDCFEANAFIEIETRRDLSGHIRMTAGRI